MRRTHPFLTASRDERPGADAVVFGAAFGEGTSFRSGAGDGPKGIRRFSDSIESFSPRLRRDLEDLTIVDVGDHAGAPPTLENAVGKVIDRTRASGGRRPLLCTLGGDHSITPPVVRAVARRTDRLAVIGFDAHTDLRKEYEGEHACVYRRIADDGLRCVVLGPRSGSREEWEDAPSVLTHCARSLEIPAAVRKQLARTDVYVTVDIDVLDPSEAPGTGNPEPGGVRFDELLAAIDALDGLRVVAFDVVEVSPRLDPSGITQAAAAVLVREMLLRFA